MIMYKSIIEENAYISCYMYIDPIYSGYQPLPQQCMVFKRHREKHRRNIRRTLNCAKDLWKMEVRRINSRNDLFQETKHSSMYIVLAILLLKSWWYLFADFLKSCWLLEVNYFDSYSNLMYWAINITIGGRLEVFSRM